MCQVSEALIQQTQQLINLSSEATTDVFNWMFICFTMEELRDGGPRLMFCDFTWFLESMVIPLVQSLSFYSPQNSQKVLEKKLFNLCI